MTKMKIYKGEKYIYLLMGFRLAQKNNNYIKIGLDTGITGGFNFERVFRIQEYKDKILLIETKSSRGFADFSRTFEIMGIKNENPTICDYMNEDLENCGRGWTH